MACNLLNAYRYLQEKRRKKILAVIILNSRRPAIFRERWRREYCMALSIEENSFKVEYRMSPYAFKRLVALLAPLLVFNETSARNAMGQCGSDVISIESRVAAALCMLGGGRYIEAMRTHGMSKSQVYDVFDRVIAAINSHPQLRIKCDNSEAALEQRAKEFERKSRGGLFEWCTGAVDGLAIKIQCPSSTKYQNQCHYYSGNKKLYCLNMQACCDAQYKFIAVSCKHVGSTNDGSAFATGLQQICDQQVFPYHWNGDNAYSASRTMMVPIMGASLTHLEDAFNFYHSQVRIRIECTFGIFVRRWGILWKPLRFDVPKCAAVVQACCRLHNFCIDNRSLGVPKHAGVDDKTGRLVDESWRVAGEDVSSVCDSNVVRNDIIKTIKDRNYERPN